MHKNGKTQKGCMDSFVGKWFFELELIVLATGNFPSISYLMSERF